MRSNQINKWQKYKHLPDYLSYGWRAADVGRKNKEKKKKQKKKQTHITKSEQIDRQELAKNWITIQYDYPSFSTWRKVPIGNTPLEIPPPRSYSIFISYLIALSLELKKVDDTETK